MNTTFNINTNEANRFDAIVIGAGLSGGWAIKECAEKGLKTLVLERGRDIKHGDYPTAHKEAWDFPHRKRLDPKILEENPIIARCYAYNKTTEHHFVKDREHPYVQKKPFDWIRGYQVGGKSLMWARWVQRWSDLDFEANAKEGIGVDWPIRYKDIAPWYSYVEKFAGISGNRDGLGQVPDGEFLPPMEMNCMETFFKGKIESQYPGRNLIISRTANLSQRHNERGPCMYRSRCERGCPYAGYFSTNSVTLPAAEKTGNMTLRPFSVVHSIIYDDTLQKATGVRIVDTNTRETTEYFADLIFVNAGTLNTALILLNSTSDRFPNGLGNDSDTLGRYLMAHDYRGGINAQYEGLQDKYYFGRRPTGTYVPRFRNYKDDKQLKFLRGYAYSCFASRSSARSEETMGADFKDSLFELGDWNISLGPMGECLPYEDNRVTLSKTQTDDWGIPQLEIDCEYKENENNMLEDSLTTGAEMMEAAGFKNISTHNSKHAPGLDIHEMGTARMGRDPKTSVLNGFNQLHAVKNVIVSDGACMTSSGCQNPSITYMALTARAANHAIEEHKKGNL